MDRLADLSRRRDKCLQDGVEPDKDRRERHSRDLYDEMWGTVETVSHVSPKSISAAVFQVMAAGFDIHTLNNAEGYLKGLKRRRALRNLCRAVNFLVFSRSRG
jgi:hypothetical protein